MPPEPAVLSAVQSLLDLFAADLPEVRFPDVDSALLEDAAERVRLHAAALERAEASAEAARQMAQESQDALLHKAHRALAYLKLYAEEAPALAQKIDSISLPRVTRKGARPESAVGGGESPEQNREAPRKRGRPAKVKDGTSSLFVEQSAGAADG